jgi:hypothetical protein
MILARGKESLKIKSLIRTGRSCTAVVTNGKGKEEKLSITDMWNQKITILNPDKKIPETTKTKKELKKAPVEYKGKIRKHEVKRADGVATTYYGEDNSILFSYWKRTH